ncbi:MAG: PfkB family carbohydrate kinase [Actinomycetota bacterium]
MPLSAALCDPAHPETSSRAAAHVVDAILGALPAAGVAVVGDFCLDAYWEVDPASDEISIETGLPVRRVVSQRYELGGAGNVAANLVAMGVGQVNALGWVGDDPFGDLLVAQLAALAIDTAGLRRRAGHPTPVYVKRLSDGVETNRIDLVATGRLTDPEIEQFAADLAQAAFTVGVVVVNQQLPTCRDPRVVATINAAAADPAAPLFVVDSRDAGHEFRAVALKINAYEAARLSALSGADSAATPADRASALSASTGKPVVVTLGDRGMVVADRGAIGVVPAVEVGGATDPVGAGDTALAGLAAALATAAEPLSAVVFANLAASIVVTKVHTTGTASASELRSAARECAYVHQPELADDEQAARYSAGGSVEVVEPPPPGLVVRHAVFDHDGTLSTLREGWEPVMVALMEEAVLGPLAEDADLVTVRRVHGQVIELIASTTGAPTIRQMEGLVGLVRAFGLVDPGAVRTAAAYKSMYNERLSAMVDVRIAQIRSGRLDPTDFRVKGAAEFLRLLQARGVVLHLASGTDTSGVRADASALGYLDLFGDRLDGATDDPERDAKRTTLERIMPTLAEGEAVVVIGDGPVEMREARRSGAVAVGVCSDERRRHGFNLNKRSRLIRSGAMLLVADFSAPGELLNALGIS